MDREKAAFAIILLALAGIVGIGAYAYREYRAQQNAYTAHFDALEFEYANGTITSIRRYLERFLFDIPIKATNNAEQPILIDEARLEIFLGSRLIEQRELKSLTVPPRSSSEVLLKDITLKTELLDAAILEAKIDKEKPEGAKLILTTKIYPVYQFKLLGREIFGLKIEPVVITKQISLLMLMGGKTQEESAKEFVPSLTGLPS